MNTLIVLACIVGLACWGFMAVSLQKAVDRFVGTGPNDPNIMVGLIVIMSASALAIVGGVDLAKWLRRGGPKR